MLQNDLFTCFKGIRKLGPFYTFSMPPMDPLPAALFDIEIARITFKATTMQSFLHLKEESLTKLKGKSLLVSFSAIE